VTLTVPSPAASVDEAEEFPLTPAQQETLEERWRGFVDDPDEGEPWEDVRKSLFDSTSSIGAPDDHYE
jgi:hypothetical protein